MSIVEIRDLSPIDLFRFTRQHFRFHGMALKGKLLIKARLGVLTGCQGCISGWPDEVDACLLTITLID